MAYSLVTGQMFEGTNSSGTTTTGAFPGNTTTGNAIVLVCVPNETATVSSISISPGSGSFTKDIAVANGAASVEIWSAFNVTGGTTPTLTVNWSGTVGTAAFEAFEFQGAPTTKTSDGTASTTGTNTALTTTAITTTTDGDLVVKGFGVAGNGNGTVETGWTEKNPMSQGHIAGFIVQGTHGSITGTDTQSPSSAFGGVIASFKPPGGVTVNLAASITARGTTTPKLGVPLIWDSGMVNWDDAIVAWNAGAPMTWDAPSAKWDDPINVWDPGNVEWDSAYYNWDDTNLTWDTGFPATWDSRTTQWNDIVLWDAGSLIWDSLTAKWDDSLLSWDAGFAKVWDSEIATWDSSIYLWDDASLKIMAAIINGVSAVTPKMVAVLNITAGLRGIAAVVPKLYADLSAALAGVATVTPKMYADLQAAITAHAAVTPKLYALLKSTLTAVASVTAKSEAILKAIITAAATLTPKSTAVLQAMVTAKAADIAALVQTQPCKATITARAQLIAQLILLGVATRFTALNNDEVMSLYSGLTEFINMISQSQWWNDYATIFALKNELVTELRARNLNVPDVLPHDTQGSNLSMKF